jgi:hypothetical protein
MRSSKLDIPGIWSKSRPLGGISGPTAPLDSFNLVQGLDLGTFLALLNRRDPPRKRIPSKDPGDISRMDYTPTPTTQELLRGWVDEWLDSGRDDSGVEDPRERNFGKARSTASAAHEPKNFRLVGRGNSLSPWFDTYDQEPTGSLYPRIGQPPRSTEYAREQLVFFLLSDVRFRLAKCRKEHCGTYFLLKHWNRQYKRGTLCDSCKRSRSEESAIKATAEVRKDAALQLHRLTAKKFAKQIRRTPSWHQQKELKDRIAGFLNAKIERSALGVVYKRGITGKWVARSENWNGIETALKGGK